MGSFKRSVVLPVFAVCAYLCAAPICSAQTHNLKVGVAKVDITPKDLTGLVGIVPRPYGGVHDRLYARALVLNNGVNTAAIVALGLVEMGDTTVLRQRIARELQSPPTTSLSTPATTTTLPGWAHHCLEPLLLKGGRIRLRLMSSRSMTPLSIL